MSLLGALGVWRLAAGPKRVKSICLSGFQVLARIPSETWILPEHASFLVLTCVLGATAPTRSLIETNAQALRYRVQPRVQIVYGQSFQCCSRLMSVKFEIRAAGHCA